VFKRIQKGRRKVKAFWASVGAIVVISVVAWAGSSGLSQSSAERFQSSVAGNVRLDVK
jgi:hypothetical protein